MRKHLSTFVRLASLVVLSAGAVTTASQKLSPTGGTGWSGATVISPVLQPDPTRGSQLNDVAVNANGLAIAAWDQFMYSSVGPYTIGAAVQSGGKWSAPFTISSTTGFSMTPRVAVGNDGTMAVSWVYQPAAGALAQAQIAVKPASASKWTTYGDTFPKPSAGGGSTTQVVPLAVDPTGNVTAAWTQFNGAHWAVQVATLAKGSSAWTFAQVSDPTVDALYPSLSVNAAGDAAVAYSAWPPDLFTTAGQGTYPQVVSRYAGKWTQPIMIPDVISPSVGYVTETHIALDQNGLATMIYKGIGVGGARQTSGGNWVSAPAVIPPPPTEIAGFLTIDLGADKNGNAVAAASVFDSTINVDRASVWVALGSPGGNWSPEQRITDPTVPIDAYATQVAVSPDGLLALVGWIDHYHGTVQVSQLTGMAWSPAKTIGHGTAWAAFQEVLGLDAGSGTVARAIWKNSKNGIQITAASYGH